ncbi:uncharacterized protein [Parasteatoda tepidariorum]|uniref:uncharacterized protein n=1 Tax=Parasteatoda tepidariorum TaxID=114398 RepID=UPI00077FD50A|nr:uncharacterized protein LOC107450529 [Parasteatoda tepidariorum]
MELTNSCSICYESFDGKETARPDVCDHVFCFDCLQKWGKLESWCPIDRKRFKKILNLNTSALIPIKPKKRKRTRVLYDVSSVCELCNKVKENDTLILCDCCDLAYHLVCLTPPLSEVPEGNWSCSVCVAVAEKLKSKQGITKKGNKRNIGLITSSESSSSETGQTNNQSNNSKINTNCSKPKTQTGGKEISSSDEPPSIKRRYVRRTKSSPRKKTKRTVLNQNMTKLRSLRPRHHVKTKDMLEWSESSDDSQSMTSTNASTYTIKGQNHSKNSTRIKTLRPRDYGRIFYDDFGDSTDTSQGCSRYDRQEKSPVEYSPNYKESNNLIAASPKSNATSTSDENSNIGLEKSFSGNCTVVTTVPEAISIPSESQNYEVNDVMNPNVCIIAASCSLKDDDSETIGTVENADVATNHTVPFSLNEKHTISSSYVSKTQAVDEDEISVIATVVKAPSIPMAIEKSEDQSQLQTKSLNEQSSEDELPAIPLIPINANDKLTAQKASSSKIFSCVKEKPLFSVFKKLENEDLAEKKYSELNEVIKINHPTNKDANCVLKKNWPDSLKLCSQNNTEGNRITNALSKELRAIEKEKWKTHRMRSENNLRHRCCKSYGRNRYKPSDVVHIGKHFCQRKYSDNYKELLSISKSLKQKPKFGEKDIVILNNLRRNDKRCSSAIHSNQSSGVPTSISMDSKVTYPHHEIISFDKDGLQGLIKSQRKLISATLCLSKLKHLDVQKDGLLCYNWQK